MNSELAAVLIGVILIAIILLLFLPARRKANASTDGDYIYRDDDRYWAGGLFYNNPDDPAVFVPKRYGMGWTVNFGNPKGKLVMFGTLLIPVVLLILNFLVTGGAPMGCHTFGCHP